MIKLQGLDDSVVYVNPDAMVAVTTADSGACVVLHGGAVAHVKECPDDVVAKCTKTGN
jgi:hypothetical protein